MSIYYKKIHNLTKSYKQNEFNIKTKTYDPDFQSMLTLRQSSKRYKEQLEKLESFPPLYPSLEKSNIRDYFFKNDKDKFKQFIKNEKYLKLIQINHKQSLLNLSLFEKYNYVEYLIKSVNLLMTAKDFYFPFISPVTGYEKTKIKYFSRDRFCYYSNLLKIEELRDRLNFSLEKYTLFDNYRISFFTLSPINIPKSKFTNQTMLSFGELRKEFFRHKLSIKRSKEILRDPLFLFNLIQRLLSGNQKNKNSGKKYLSDKQLNFVIKDIEEFFPQFLKERPCINELIKGYSSFVEIKEKDDSYNLHCHILGLRDKDFAKGYISKYYCQEVFKEVSNSFSQFKGSEIFDIRSRTDKNESWDIQNSIKYLATYVTKGIDVKSDESWEQIIHETKGVRFENSGGLLSKHKFKEMSINYNVEKSLYRLSTGAIEEFDGENIYFGGKKKGNLQIKDPVKFPLFQDKELSYLFNNKFLTTLQRDLLYIDTQVCNLKTKKIKNIQIKTELYKQIYDSMFGKTPILDPILSSKNGINKLEFNTFKEEKYETDWRNINFFCSALNKIGVYFNQPSKFSQQSIKLKDNYFLGSQINSLLQIEETIFQEVLSII